jgi:hypothetical protein
MYAADFRKTVLIFTYIIPRFWSNIKEISVRFLDFMWRNLRDLEI